MNNCDLRKNTEPSFLDLPGIWRHPINQLESGGSGSSLPDMCGYISDVEPCLEMLATASI